MDNNYFSAMHLNDIDIISSEIFNLIKGKDKLVIICIGTDTCIGDSIGPLTGTLLKENKCPCLVIGDLRNVINNKNIDLLQKNIKEKYKDYCIIAIDACLGYKHDIGKILLKKGAISPASALKNQHVFIGDISIKAIVNSYSSTKYANIYILQHTSLFYVYSMAQVLNYSIVHALNENLKYLKEQKTKALS